MPAPVAAAAPAAPAAPNAPTAVTNIAVPPKVPPAAPAQTKPGTAPAEAEPTFEVTIDGQPQLLTRKQIEKFAGKGGFADKLIRQAKDGLRSLTEKEKQLLERESIWDDDAKLEAELEKRGKLDLLARKKLAAKIAESEMTPEQKAHAEDRRKLDEANQKLKEVEEEKAQAQLVASAKKLQARMEGELASAAERAGLPRDAESFYAVYEALKEFRELGLINPKEFSATDADRICEAAVENIAATDKRREGAVLKGLKGKALVDRLGKSVVDEVLRYKLELLRGGGEKKPGSPPPSNGNAKSDDNGFLTVDQARQMVRGLGK